MTKCRKYSDDWREIFWSRVTKDDSKDCWVWNAARFPFGYGAFRRKGGRNMESAHRLAYELIKGPIPKGLWVLHKCDNPPCCNPDHLFLGAHQDNVDDMVAKNRSALAERSGPRKHPERYPKGDRHYSRTNPERLNPLRGDLSPKAKLTTSQVVEIRRRCGYRNLAALGREFGVSTVTILHIRGRKSWTHI